MTCPTHSNDRQEYLDSWLGQATQDLCPESRERVCDEVTVRFNEMVAAGRAAGLDKEKATHQAYIALGDAREARREFSKVYLTETEAMLTGSLFKEPSALMKKINLGYCLSLILILVTQLHDASGNEVWLIPACIMAASICQISCVVLFFWPHLSLGWRLFHKTLSNLMYLLIFMSDMPEMDRKYGTWFTGLFGGALLFLVLVFIPYYYRAWLKLRRQQEVHP